MLSVEHIYLGMVDDYSLHVVEPAKHLVNVLMTKFVVDSGRTYPHF
jgi:hypothetical protein